MQRRKFPTISVSREPYEAGRQLLIERGYTSWNGFIRGIIARHDRGENVNSPSVLGRLDRIESALAKPPVRSGPDAIGKEHDRQETVRVQVHEESRDLSGGPADIRVPSSIQQNPRANQKTAPPS